MVFPQTSQTLYTAEKPWFSGLAEQLPGRITYVSVAPFVYVWVVSLGMLSFFGSPSWPHTLHFWGMVCSPSSLQVAGFVMVAVPSSTQVWSVVAVITFSRFTLAPHLEQVTSYTQVQVSQSWWPFLSTSGS